MNRTRVFAFATSLFLAAGGSARPARADEQPAQPAPAALRDGIRRAVTVTVMDLDVVATAGGRPVTDLTKTEIVMEIDGKKLPLDYFARVDSGTLHGPDLATASPDVLLDALRNDSGDRFLPRQFLIFFDDAHLTPVERKRVVEGLRDFVTHLSPSDRASLVAYGTSTRVVTPYTSSKETLLDGLSRVDSVAPAGLMWETQYRSDVSQARRSRASTREGIIRSWGAQASAREKGTLAEFARAIAALSARSGKRAVLYVSNGLELHPGQTFHQALGPGSGLGQFDWSVVPEFEQVIAAANRSGITIHALDAKGLMTDVDAGDSAPSPFDPFSARQNFTEALSGFARETGGLLVTNRNEFKPALDRIWSESSSYYAVGVTLEGADPKKENHKVRVSSTRPGVELRTRRSYAPKGADEAARDRIEMALMTPDVSGDFTAPFSLGTPTSKGAGLGRRLVPYQVAVPLSELTFVDDAGVKKAVLEVFVGAVEDNGAKSGVSADRKTISVDPSKLEKAKGEMFRYEGTMKSRAGNLRFVAGVRDVATGRMSLAQQSVRIE